MLQRVCFGVGLGLLGVSVALGVLSYGISPLFTDEPWIIASPPLHLISILVSVAMVWAYMRRNVVRKAKGIDHRLKQFMAYRIVRALLLLSLGLIGFVIKVIFFAWIRQSPSGGRYDRERTADDIWDTHPEHYYDKEPPKPFS